MTYDETLDYLFTATPMFHREGAGAYKPGLETTLCLSGLFGNPHQGKFETIHVAGTNGKGSTTHSIAAVLKQAGYKVGLFTSPHLVDFRERIRINGEMISKEEVAAFVDRYLKLNPGLHPSFFELTTIMAFDHFARHEVDVAVIEVGLGGRLDSTNIITPVLSIITNISLDHTSLLGDTAAAIAAEKAGIIKHGVPVVIGEADDPEVREVFSRTATRLEAPVTFACDNVPFSSYSCGELSISYSGTPFGTVVSDLTGNCQPLNMATILTSLHQLRQRFDRIDDASVTSGLADVTGLTGLTGRWMTISTNPRVIIDTGHNPGGWKYISQQLNEVKATTRHVLIGMAADKDIDTVLSMISGIADSRLYFTAPSTPRAMPAAELARLAARHGLEGEVVDSVAEAYATAMNAATKDDLIFVGGSNFVIADLLASL